MWPKLPAFQRSNSKMYGCPRMLFFFLSFSVSRISLKKNHIWNSIQDIKKLHILNLKKPYLLQIKRKTHVDSNSNRRKFTYSAISRHIEIILRMRTNID